MAFNQGTGHGSHERSLTEFRTSHAVKANHRSSCSLETGAEGDRGENERLQTRGFHDHSDEPKAQGI